MFFYYYHYHHCYHCRHDHWYGITFHVMRRRSLLVLCGWLLSWSFIKL